MRIFALWENRGGEYRAPAIELTVFGFAGLLMAAIGVYGVMPYSVQHRRQELGVRMALGAQASNLRNMVMYQGMTLTLIGVLISVGGALLAPRTFLLTSSSE